MKSSNKVIPVLFLLLISCSQPKVANDYPITPVDITHVSLSDSFWAPVIDRNLSITFPAVLNKLQETGRIKNFEQAAAVLDGTIEGASFCTTFPFDDSDIYKFIEAGTLAMAYDRQEPGSALDRSLDSLIGQVAKAQEPDGYLYTARTMNPDPLPEMSGSERWINEQDNSHELYNLGHLYEAACTHYRLTGKKNLLDIATRSADFLYETFIKGGLNRYPGHEEIETGLAHLYRTTGDKRYLELADYFLSVRGPGGQEYNQAHQKPVDQREARGHAVRAVYLYSGMTEAGVLKPDNRYLEAVKALWGDITQSKTYVTGGIGSRQDNEGFGDPFDLPNHSAYCETCSSIGFILWNYRMFRQSGESHYIDLLEKTLYNAFLSGISLSGDRFFYPNPLESWGRKIRPDWYACACCPPNVARLIPMVPGFQYATAGDTVFVNLFAAGEATFKVAGKSLKINQKTRYPWDGEIQLDLTPGTHKEISILLRLPGWSLNQAFPTTLYRYERVDSNGPEILLNGEKAAYSLSNGYAILRQSWKPGDRITLRLPMPLRFIAADERVKANTGKVAVQRGPIIWCAESADNEVSPLISIVKPENYLLATQQNPDPANPAIRLDSLVLIPYHRWANREPGHMAVWFPTAPEYITHVPTAPGLEAGATATASYAYDSSLPYLNDGIEPMNSADRGSNAFRLHPKKGTTEWVQYSFENPVNISSTEIYWLQDGSYGLPVGWALFWLDTNGSWQPVKARSPYTITPDQFNRLSFAPVTTTAIRLDMTLSTDLPGGIIEWRLH